MYSTSLSVGLRRDISTDFKDPEAKVPISIRELRSTDTGIILQHGEFSKTNPRLADYQKNLSESNLPQCFVAVSENDDPCYMQWLIGPEHNNKLSEIFGNAFPQLEKNEALLEAAFMSPSYRGKHIMPAAMSRISKQARNLEGISYVNTFVDIQNIPSLKGCKRAGFSPYLLRKDHWFLFRREISFSQLPKDILARYEAVTA
ncbi:MAG: GNAT family protein [Balneolaceae bacterium]